MEILNRVKEFCKLLFDGDGDGVENILLDFLHENADRLLSNDEKAVFHKCLRHGSFELISKVCTWGDIHKLLSTDTISYNKRFLLISRLVGEEYTCHTKRNKFLVTLNVDPYKEKSKQINDIFALYTNLTFPGRPKMELSSKKSISFNFIRNDVNPSNGWISRIPLVSFCGQYIHSEGIFSGEKGDSLFGISSEENIHVLESISNSIPLCAFSPISGGQIDQSLIKHFVNLHAYHNRRLQKVFAAIHNIRALFKPRNFDEIPPQASLRNGVLLWTRSHL